MELIVLGLVASIGVASYALWSRARAAEAPPAPPLALESGERTAATLQVGDVVQHLGTDWVVEGVLALSEDGGAAPELARGARLYRLVDGSAECFLFASAADSDPALLSPATSLSVEGAPGSVEHAGLSYRLKTRVTASAIRSGVVGARRSTERVGVAEYVAGVARLLVLSWGAGESDAFVGERVANHLLEFLPCK